MASNPAAGATAADPAGWKSLPGQTALLGAGYVARSVGSLALAVILSRALGPAGYGQVGVFLALSWGLFFVTGSWLLLAVPALGAGPQGRAPSDVMWQAALVASAGLALSLGVLAAAALAMEDRASELLVRSAWPVVAVAAAVLLCLHCLYALLQATGDAGWVALLQGGDRVAATAAAALALWIYTDDAVTAMWAMTAGTALVLAAALFAPPARRHLRRPSAGTAGLREMFAYSGPLVVTNVCAYVVGWAGVLVLAVMADDREVGVFALASQIYALPLALAGVWVLAAVPAYARAGGESDLGPAVERVDLAGRWWATLIAAAGLLAAILFRPLFGGQFDETRSMLAVMLIGAATVAFYYAVAPVLIADGRARTLMHLSAAGAAATLVIDIALVGWLGAWAAVIGTVVQAVAVSAVLAGRRYGADGVLRLARGTALPAATLALVAAWPDEAWALGAALACLAAATAVALRRTPGDMLPWRRG